MHFTQDQINAIRDMPLQPIMGRVVRITMDDNGNVLKVLDSRQTMRFASMAEELVRAGNVGEYFDTSFGRFSSHPDLKKNNFISLRNKKQFMRLEEPDRFYTVLHTATLFVLPLGKNNFIGVIRDRDIMPNICLESASCIIYVDDQDRLVGFNSSFYDLFRKRGIVPEDFLNQPMGIFLNPTPIEAHALQINQSPVPALSNFKEQYTNNFSKTKSLKEISCSEPGAIRFTEDGLICSNHTDDIIFFTLPVFIDSRKDIAVILEAETLEGMTPVFFLGREFNLTDVQEAYPDIEGYQLGPDPGKKRFMAKRKGTIQNLGESITQARSAHYGFYKINQTLWLLENNEPKMAYCDFNFLHYKKMQVTIGVRLNSTCRFTRVWMGTAGRAFHETRLTLPVVSVKSPQRNYAILNRISNTSAATAFPEVSIYLLENVTEIQKQVNVLEQENRRLLRESGRDPKDFIGSSPGMVAIKRNASIVAQSDSTVLIQGETGTGKEMLARFIHAGSQRAQGPFVKVDCSTLSRTLMESELFGHEKGAFTGAIAQKKGSLELAHEGTLFLDEVGNLSLETQAKLLHFLQDHTITRVGGQAPIQIDVRVLVASNVPLSDLVEQKVFRSDLFFRMDVVSITLPPLRERKDDIPELCRRFIDEANQSHSKTVRDLSVEAYHRIYDHGWPGNIRELKNTVERAVIFCEKEVIEEDLITFAEIAGVQPVSKRRPYQFRKIDTDEVKRLVKKHGGNLKQVAAEMNIPRRTFYTKIREMGFSAAELRKL